MSIRLSGADRKMLGSAIKSHIDAACVLHFEEKPRDHLGASEIGEPCLRKLVYGFRWMHWELFNGQKYRLFNRGHKEELRVSEWFALIDAKLYSHDTNSGKQFRINSYFGHYGGSLDAIIRLPEHYGTNGIGFLGEIKTHSAKSFAGLERLGVQQSKPKHYAQMCVYGAEYNLDYAIYIAVNKNDDNLHIEIVEVDRALAEKMKAKAFAVITATKLPPKIAGSPAYLECKFCNKRGVCHENKSINVNCRSCRNSTALPDGTWLCNVWASVIPKEAIPAACPQWAAFT